MKISDLSATELLRLLRVSEQSSDPDDYALSVLRRELDRRLDLAKDRDSDSTGREATSKSRPNVRRVITRLLKAVDQSIRAADEAKSARDELMRLSGKREEATTCK